MTLEVVNQDRVLDRALDLVRGARERLWITSPWITQRAVNLLLREVLPRVQAGELQVRIVHRIKEPTDLQITDLEALKTLEDAGCDVKYSTRLHAKLLLVDSDAAIVSSSNLTATAGYSVDFPSEWRNEELGVVIGEEPAVLAELEREFSRVWDAANRVGDETVGISMDFPTVATFNFVAIREVRVGQYAVARDPAGHPVVGQVTEITAYNRSFPRMNETMWLTQGYPGSGDQRGRVEVPDLQALFSHPSKEHGFLVTKTFFEPESVFQIARVQVLKTVQDGVLVAPSVPIAPGADVSRASPELLNELLGGGDLEIGTVLHHRDVEVRLRTDEILSKHLAVLGMTGSGKSNALKVLIQNLLRDRGDSLRVVVVDTHGEYVPIAPSLSPRWRLVDVELRESLLEESVVKELVKPLQWRDDVLFTLVGAVERLGEEASVEEVLTEVEHEANSMNGQPQARLRQLVTAGRRRSDLCLLPEQTARVVGDHGATEDLLDRGLYIVDLRDTPGLDVRAVKTAAVLNQVFESSKAAEDAAPTLVVVDEAQNYAAEQQTGWMARVRPALDAMFQIASEGRKFRVALAVSTQRPAQVNKDILSQCNTHMIFRVANVEYLRAIEGSFEAGSREVVGQLPGFDTGVCLVGGTAVGMVTRVKVPLFEV